MRSNQLKISARARDELVVGMKMAIKAEKDFHFHSSSGRDESAWGFYSSTVHTPKTREENETMLIVYHN